MPTKKEAIVATEQLKEFLERELPKTGVFTVEAAIKFASRYDLVKRGIEQNDFSEIERKNPLGGWRVLADYFGISEEHEIMGPYIQMSRVIADYLRHSSNE